MGWVLLIAGLALWIGSHTFKRLHPAQRAAMGDKAKAFVALANVLAIVLMVIGYQQAAFVTVWSSPAFFTHINNLLMIIAVYFFFAGSAGAGIASKIRHPQLTGFKTWAFAHLLVNGDLASILLFGGLLGWAVWQMILINRAEPDWTRPTGKGMVFEVIYGVVALGIYVVIGLAHNYLGVWPFG